MNEGKQEERGREIPTQVQRYDVELNNLNKAISALREALVPVMSQPKTSDVDTPNGKQPTCPVASDLFALNNQLCGYYTDIDGIINSLEV